MLFALLAVIGVGLAALVLLPRVLGFRAQRPVQYAGQGPAFDARTHLSGPILCEGVIYGPLGRVSSRFVADMHGTWQGNQGRLTEKFTYESGVQQDRAWALTLVAEMPMTLSGKVLKRELVQQWESAQHATSPP
jgi:hypothetical protein